MASAASVANAISWPNFDNNATGSAIPADPHTSLQDFAIAIEVILPVLSFVVCCLRCYIRVSTKNIGWDDYWIFGAMILCIGQAVVSIIFIKVSYVAIHTWDIPPHDTYHPIFINYIGGLIYNPILSMVKISVLVFLLRLAGTRPAVQATIYALMFVTVGLMIAIFFSVVFVCSPVEFNWNPSITDGKCFDKRPFSIWTASVAIFTDILVLALPFWIFLGLRMARKAKIALLCVFAIGGVVTIIGGVRLYFIYKSMYLPRVGDYNYSIGYVTTAFETNLAVVAASGPALWPLARRWFPGFFSGLGLSRGYQGHIPPIETTSTPHELAKERSGASSRSGNLLRLVFAHRKGGNSPSPSRPRKQDNRRFDGAGGVHTDHTIGGTSFVMKDMRGDRARGRTEIRSRTPEEEEEEIMTYDGIMRTTDYTITRDDRSSGVTERSWFDQLPRGK